MFKSDYNRRSIEFFHKVKFPKITTQKEFELAFEYWNKPHYNSYLAEKDRIVSYCKKIKDVNLNLFNKLLNSYLYNINAAFKLSDMNKQIFVMGKNKILYKLLLFDQTTFVAKYIEKDVIYTDKFEFFTTHNSIKITKIMKTPFPMNKMSLKLLTARFEFYQNAKQFCKQVKTGLLQND